MLYHFQIPFFKGGFVGVDVFFVLSGYLMTRIILQGMEKGNGWLLNFYYGRARRIVPAVLVLCAVLLFLGWFLVLPEDYRKLAKHSVAALTFRSNVTFWKESGYFDVASHEKWLLHTWSLSVEWQFYLLYPLILWVARRLFGLSSIRYVIAGMFVVSLIISVFVTQKHPTAAFYLLHTRMWELLAGAVVFLVHWHSQLTTHSGRILEAVGFLLIFSAILGFDAQTPWPGWRALVPVLGCMCILLASRQNSIWTRPKAFQAIGSASYSIYLWHWPVVVLLGYFALRDSSRLLIIGMVVALGLGCASYLLVEQHTRRWLSRLKPLPTFVVLAIAGISIAVPARVIRHEKGVPDRFGAEIVNKASEAENINPRQEECHGVEGEVVIRCVHGGKNIKAIIIGDSHAMSLVSALQKALADPNAGAVSFTYTSCPTVAGVKMKGLPNLKCAEFNQSVLKEISTEPSLVPIFIVNRTSYYIFGSNRPDEINFHRPAVYFDSEIDSPTEEFQKEFAARMIDMACNFAKIRPTFLIRPIPEMQVNVPKYAARRILFGEVLGDISIKRDEYENRHSVVKHAQDEAHRLCGVGVLDPVPYLCDEKTCNAIMNGRPIYYDSDHLSEYGNTFLIPMFKTVLN